MSWRRKYFYNEKSWQRYIYYAKILCKLNEHLRNGYDLKKPNSLRLINNSSRFIFTKDRYPILGLSLNGKVIELEEFDYANGKILFELPKKQIRDKYKFYRRLKDGKFKQHLLY